MDKLFCKNLSGYRYEAKAPCFIPFASTRTVLASQNQNIEHPYFKITNDGVFVKTGYAWDGATGVLWQSKNLRVPSLVHDIGCQAVNLGLLPQSMQAIFDYEYRQQALKYGVSPLRAETHYAAILAWGEVKKLGLIKTRESTAKYAEIHEIKIL